MAYRKPSNPSCRCGKVAYGTEADALDFLARSRRWAAGMHAYHCGPGQCWHVGHARQSARRAS